MKPKISVIIPVYNVEPYIRQCLDSIIAQTYCIFEAIIIDNSSTDDSGKICDEYAQRDKRIRVIHKKNEGVGVSRNLGIDEAQGEWLAFIDSDDWIESDYLEALINYTIPEGADIIFSGGYIEEGAAEKKIKRYFDRNFADKTPEFHKLLISKILAPNAYKNKMPEGNNLGTTWGKLYRVNMLRTNGLRFLVHIEPGMDTLFNMAVLNAAKEVRCEQYVGYHYRCFVPTGAMHKFHPEVVQTSYDYMIEMWEYNNRNRIKVDDDILYARAFIMIMLSFRTYFFHPENTIPFAEKVKEIRDYKNNPFVNRVIFRKENSLLTSKQIIFKYILRFSWAKPLLALYLACYKTLRIANKR